MHTCTHAHTQAHTGHQTPGALRPRTPGALRPKPPDAGRFTNPQNQDARRFTAQNPGRPGALLNPRTPGALRPPTPDARRFTAPTPDARRFTAQNPGRQALYGHNPWTPGSLLKSGRITTNTRFDAYYTQNCPGRFTQPDLATKTND